LVLLDAGDVPLRSEVARSPAVALVIPYDDIIRTLSYKQYNIALPPHLPAKTLYPRETSSPTFFSTSSFDRSVSVVCASRPCSAKTQADQYFCQRFLEREEDLGVPNRANTRGSTPRASLIRTLRSGLEALSCGYEARTNCLSQSQWLSRCSKMNG
jgi:hypothetical protein